MSARAMPIGTTAPGPARARGERDPLAAMLGTDERSSLAAIAVGIALSLHGIMVGPGVEEGILHDVRVAVDDNRARVHDFFWRTYEVEVEKPKDEPPPPEPPPPEPAPAPKAAVKPVQDDDPYKNLPPPTPAKAAAVMTADKKADDPPELPGFVTGDGTATYGMQSGSGKGDTPTMQRNASLEGKPGGKGTAGPVQEAPPAEDKSRSVGLSGATSWNCPFPPEADADQIDHAVVGVQVTVRPDGSAQSASVVSDPGHGFGRAAKQCALARRYQPALDALGTAILGSGRVNVNFNR